MTSWEKKHSCLSYFGKCLCYFWEKSPFLFLSLSFLKDFLGTFFLIFTIFTIIFLAFAFKEEAFLMPFLEDTVILIFGLGEGRYIIHAEMRMRV